MIEMVEYPTILIDKILKESAINDILFYNLLISLIVLLFYIYMKQYCNSGRYIKIYILYFFFVPFITIRFYYTMTQTKEINIHSIFYWLFLSNYKDTFLYKIRFLVEDCLGLYILYNFYNIIHNIFIKCIFLTKKDCLDSMGNFIINNMIKKIPFTNKNLENKIKEFENIIYDSLKKDITHLNKNIHIPKYGINKQDIINELEIISLKETNKCINGYVSGTVYNGEQPHLDFLNKINNLYSISNPLHVDIWPSIMKFESEIISMTASLMNPMVSPNNNLVCGSVTSGGTESIILTVKAHREWLKKEKNINKPEIIACITAHAAIDKACELLHIKLIKIPMNKKTFQIDLKLLLYAINSNTIMLYGSAPNFPHGIIDDIESLSKIAIKYEIGLHVDCCLGGFILPFINILQKKNNNIQSIEPFDFSLQGVTSMSCDTHKYGYSTKGTSVILYKNKNIRKYQYFIYPNWTGGLYGTPTLAGSRSGGIVATAWASMMYLGIDGFLNYTEKIMKTVYTIINEIENGHSTYKLLKNNIYIIGKPKAMIISFGSYNLNILKIGEEMKKRNWLLNNLQYPTSIHICITLQHVGKEILFLNDLCESIQKLLNDSKKENSSCNTQKSELSIVHIYGMTSTLPSGPVNEIVSTYIDATLTP